MSNQVQAITHKEFETFKRVLAYLYDQASERVDEGCERKDDSEVRIATSFLLDKY